jgi:hypothetical protein
MGQLIKEAGSNMKKIAAIITAFIVVYSIYYDLTVGTVPGFGKVTLASSEIAEVQPLLNDNPYTLIETKPGDTVLSIVEKLHQGPLPVPIDTIIQDFQELNQNLKPEKIQIGKQYKIPLYSQTAE